MRTDGRRHGGENATPPGALGCGKGVYIAGVQDVHIYVVTEPRRNGPSRSVLP